MKRWGVLLLVLIALCLASETALAYATPPDETWIAGVYDDDDGDDVVVSLVWAAWAVSLPPAPPPWAGLLPPPDPHPRSLARHSPEGRRSHGALAIGQPRVECPRGQPSARAEGRSMHPSLATQLGRLRKRHVRPLRRARILHLLESHPCGRVLDAPAGGAPRP